MTPTTPKKRDRVLRIALCIVALAALLTAFTYMLFEIVTDVNTTQKLMLEAFLATEKELTTNTSTAADETTQKDPITEEIPTKNERESVNVDLSDETLKIQNATSYAIDEDALAAFTFEKHLFDTRPMILIFHSDPAASYWQEGKTSVQSSHPFRDNDPERTVVAVGRAIADVLSSAGIASLHITEPISDSAALVKEQKTLYPSLHYVLDVRRDGIYTTDGRIVKSDGKIGSEAAAQILFATGCDIGGAGLSWQKNLAAAYRLSELLHKAEKRTLRPILLRPEALNQQDGIIHLTAFIGTTGNTVSEAITSARFFARYLAIFILSNCGVS